MISLLQKPVCYGQFFWSQILTSVLYTPVRLEHQSPVRLSVYFKKVRCHESNNNLIGSFRSKKLEPLLLSLPFLNVCFNN